MWGMDVEKQLQAVKAELAARRPRAVAEHCGLAYDTVLRIIRGDTTPRIETLHKLQRYLFAGASTAPQNGQAKAVPDRESA
jgi:hypothetical protein